MPDLDSEVIDFRAASESFADLRTLRRRDLETLRILARYQGRLVPTVGGVLLFGKDRDRYTTSAFTWSGRRGGSRWRNIAHRYRGMSEHDGKRPSKKAVLTPSSAPRPSSWVSTSVHFSQWY